MTKATGTFEVKMQPQGEYDKGEGSTLGRFSLEKSFSGDLVADGKGEMLTAGTESGSAVYVAIERVTGSLHGKSGAFALYHNGVMTKESQELKINIVPDSGSGELAGIKGSLAIRIVEKQHFYDLDYSLA